MECPWYCQAGKNQPGCSIHTSVRSRDRGSGVGLLELAGRASFCSRWAAPSVPLQTIMIGEPKTPNCNRVGTFPLDEQEFTRFLF